LGVGSTVVNQKPMRWTVHEIYQVK
jgi:hypothetical protein